MEVVDPGKNPPVLSARHCRSFRRESRIEREEVCALVRSCCESLRSRLKLPIETLASGEKWPEVSFDPVRRCHLFSFPFGSDPAPEIESLFLCHALLAERVHPLFSCVLAEGPDALPEKVFERQIWPVLSCTRTWFAQALWVKHCPSQARTAIQSRFSCLLEKAAGGFAEEDLAGMLEIALVSATRIRFCGASGLPEGKMKEFVMAFLSVGPEKPHLSSLTRLNALLLRATSSFSVKPEYHPGFCTEIWRIA